MSSVNSPGLWIVAPATAPLPPMKSSVLSEYPNFVTSAAPPGTHVNKEWQNSFVIGLVPPPELNVKDQCPQGVTKVETERSFLNGLVAAITQSIYTPMHTEVTCSAR